MRLSTETLKVGTQCNDVSVLRGPEAHAAQRCDSTLEEELSKSWAQRERRVGKRPADSTKWVPRSVTEQAARSNHGGGHPCHAKDWPGHHAVLT